MSQENVELVLKIHAAFNRGDLDGLVEMWDPECEYHSAIHQVVEGEAGVFRGHDGIRLWWRELHDLYEDLGTEILEARHLGDVVVVVFVIRGRGRSSDVTLATPLAQVATTMHGRVVAARDYFSRAEALEAVGLRE